MKSLQFQKAIETGYDALKNRNAKERLNEQRKAKGTGGNVAKQTVYKTKGKESTFGLLFMWLFQQMIMCEMKLVLCRERCSDLVLIERIRAHATRRHKHPADARSLTIRVVNNPIPFLQS